MSSKYTKELLVSNRNVRILVDFCKKKGVEINSLLEGFVFSKEYLMDPDKWIPLEVYREITDRAFKILGEDINMFYEIGLTATSSGDLGALEAIKRVLGVFVADPKYLFKKVPAYNNFFNHTKSFELIDVCKTGAIMKVQFAEGIDPVYDFNSGPHIKGVLASVPLLWKLPVAQVEELLLEYDVLKLLQERFGLPARIENGKLYINNEEYGHEVEIVKHYAHACYVCLGEYKELEARRPTKELICVVITKEFIYKHYPLLKVGQIYNAPYFILKVSWEHASYFRRLFSYFANKAVKGAEDKVKKLEKKAEEIA